MLSDYIAAAMGEAHYEILAGDGSYYGEIEGLWGVWANAQTLEECRRELEEVLEGWIIVSLWRNLELPEVGGISVGPPQQEEAG